MPMAAMCGSWTAPRPMRPPLGDGRCVARSPRTDPARPGWYPRTTASSTRARLVQPRPRARSGASATAGESRYMANHPREPDDETQPEDDRDLRERRNNRQQASDRDHQAQVVQRPRQFTGPQRRDTHQQDPDGAGDPTRNRWLSAKGRGTMHRPVRRSRQQVGSCPERAVTRRRPVC